MIYPLLKYIKRILDACNIVVPQFEDWLNNISHSRFDSRLDSTVKRGGWPDMPNKMSDK
jgi:hypothetical protein